VFREVDCGWLHAPHAHNGRTSPFVATQEKEATAAEHDERLRKLHAHCVTLKAKNDRLTAQMASNKVRGGGCRDSSEVAKDTYEHRLPHGWFSPANAVDCSVNYARRDNCKATFMSRLGDLTTATAHALAQREAADTEVDRLTSVMIDTNNAADELRLDLAEAQAAVKVCTDTAMTRRAECIAIALVPLLKTCAALCL
jgi:hypothetical protein